MAAQIRALLTMLVTSACGMTIALTLYPTVHHFAVVAVDHASARIEEEGHGEPAALGPMLDIFRQTLEGYDKVDNDHRFDRLETSVNSVTQQNACHVKVEEALVASIEQVYEIAARHGDIKAYANGWFQQDLITALAYVKKDLDQARTCRSA